MSFEIVDIDNGYDNFFELTEELTKMDVDVGYDQSSGSEDDVLLVDLASFHELGEGNPARPFMRNSFDNNEQEIGDTGVKLADKFLEGKINAKLAHEIWGDSLRKTIRNGVITRELGLKKNEDSTIDRKGSDTPLIDTKRMINGIDVMVNTK